MFVCCVMTDCFTVSFWCVQVVLTLYTCHARELICQQQLSVRRHRVYVQGDLKFSVQLMFTTQKVTINVQRAPLQSPVIC
jgi:hypothetical protein